MHLFLRNFILTLLFVLCLNISTVSIATDPNGTLVFSLGGEVSVLNPILSTDSSSASVEDLIFAGLARVNEKLEIIPDMAQSWTTSKDGRVWIIYLKRNIKWHDGVEFTAQDVKFTFDSILNPKVNSVRRSDLIIDGSPIRFRVINKYTIEAILPKPFAPFLSRLAASIIPKHIYEKEDINTSKFNRRPIGTGPFKFSEWKTGDYIKVVRNDSYFKGKPLLAAVKFKIIPDENATLVAFEANEIDSCGVPAKDYKRMKLNRNVNVYEYDSLLYTYLGLNNDKPIFKEKQVRQAIAYAINKDQIISLVLKKLGTKAFCPMAPVSWSYSDDVSRFDYNPQKAQKILEGLGYKKGQDGYLYKNGKRFEFTCIVNQGNKDRERAAVIIGQQLKKVGIKMDISVVEWAALLKILNNPNPKKDFDAIIMGWSLGIDPDSYSIWHSSQYPRGFNFIKYKNPKVDRLLERGRVELNKNKRKIIYGEIYKEISFDQPYVFLWYPKNVIAVSKKVHGLSRPGPAGVFVNMEKVWVE